MGFGPDEIDVAVAQCTVGFVCRRHQLQVHVKALLAEETQLHGRQHRKVRIRDHVGNGKLHGILTLSVMPYWLLAAVRQSGLICDYLVICNTSDIDGRRR
jgi:hypothetical protein